MRRADAVPRDAPRRRKRAAGAHAVIEFVDIAGLVKGASKGEGLGNKFLSHIREVDSILEVVRCFEDPNIVHVDGSIDPIRDIETINLELVFADLETVNKRLERAKKLLKGDKTYKAEIDLLEKVKETLEQGKPARILELSEEEKEIIKDSFLLTMKPILYVTNVSENEISEDNKYVEPDQIPFKAEHLGHLVELIDKGTISSSIGKKVIEELFENPAEPEEIIKEKGWIQISDEGAIKEVVIKQRNIQKQAKHQHKAVTLPHRKGDRFSVIKSVSQYVIH